MRREREKIYNEKTSGSIFILPLAQPEQQQQQPTKTKTKNNRVNAR